MGLYYVDKWSTVEDLIILAKTVKLHLGDHVWIGEVCHLPNLESLRIMSHTAVGHGAFLAAAGHDTRAVSLRYRSAPILVEEGAGS